MAVKSSPAADAAVLSSDAIHLDDFLNGAESATGYRELLTAFARSEHASGVYKRPRSEWMARLDAFSQQIPQ